MFSHAKRMKLDSEKSTLSWTLRPVLSDDFLADVPLVSVWVDEIKNKKYISSIISNLNKMSPVLSLQHLKRVKENQILISGATVDRDVLLAKLKLMEHCVLGLSLNPHLLEVPAMPPRTKAQFTSCNRVWPCNFHPDKTLEDKLAGMEFSPNDLQCIESWMKTCLDLVRGGGVGCVVVDAGRNQWVASGVRDRLNHPLKHAAMVAIDNAAKAQGGGAWQEIMDEERINTECDTSRIKSSEYSRSYTQCIVPSNHDSARRSVNYGLSGTQGMVNDEPVPLVSSAENSSGDLSEDHHEGPYLCTGYDVYLTIEPCLMCAMALVHSRAKRIFYGCPNRSSGALGSRLKLHAIPNLNHHYEVYAGVLEKDCEAAYLKYCGS